MKKRIIMWALMLMVGFSSTFANDLSGVSEKVIASFQKDFTSAKDVSWETSQAYVKATFTINDQVMFAYYSQDAELLAVTRNILSSQLPINLMSELKKKYNDYWISDLFEMASKNATSYYVSLENADQTIVLKSTGTNGWEVYKKDKKD